MLYRFTLALLLLLTPWCPSVAEAQAPALPDWEQVLARGTAPSAAAYRLGAEGQDAVFLAGYHTAAPRGLRPFVTKVGPAGQELWRAEGPETPGGAPPPLVLSLAADSSGGVYAAFGMDGEVSVAHYSATGEQRWRVPVPLIGIEAAQPYSVEPGAEVDLISDAAGVYVGGSARDPSNSGLDSAVLTRFDRDGMEEWRRVEEPRDEPPYGLLYFRGMVPAADGVIVYSAALTAHVRSDGTEAWRVANGSVYLMAARPTGGVVSFGYGTGVIGALSAAGELDWSAPWPQTFSLFQPQLTVSETGQVYVAGIAIQPDGSQGVGVLAWSATGDLLWERFYTTPNLPEVRAARADADGVVVAGGSYEEGGGVFVLRYDADGTLAWLDERPSVGDEAALTVLAGIGDAIVAAGAVTAEEDASPVCRAARFGYTTAGAPLWEAYADGAPASLDAAAFLEADADGTWLAGRTGGAGGTDLAVTRTDEAGAVRWTRTLDSADFGFEAGSADEATAFALADGGALVGGQAGGRPVAVLLDGSGAVRWQTAVATGLGEGWGEVVVVAPTADGAYLGVEAVVAPTSPTTFDTQALVVRLDADGQQRWTAERGGPYGDGTAGVFATPYGALAVTQETDGALQEGRAVLSAYSPDGSTLWQTTYGDGFESRVSQVGVDAEGRVRMLARKPYQLHGVGYDADGVLEWERYMGFGNEGGFPDGEPVGMGVAPDGSVTAAGAVSRDIQDPDGYWGPVAYRLSPEGELDWIAPLEHEASLALSVAPSGHAAVLLRGEEARALYTAVVGPEGDVRARVVLPGDERNLPFDFLPRGPYQTPQIALAPSLDLYASRNEVEYLPIAPYATPKVSEAVLLNGYRAEGLSVSAAPELADAGFAVSAPFPNPSRAGGSGVRAYVTAPEPGDVTVEVFDVLGRAVAPPRTVPVRAGANEVRAVGAGLAPGAYVVRVRTPWGSAVQRLTRAD